MLKEEVNKHPDAKGFIFDGFPRTTAQAIALDIFLGEENSEIEKLICLTVDDNELRRRLAYRAIDSGRADDADPDVINKRIEVYKNETEPVIAHYKSQDKYISIDGVGDIGDIFQRLTNAIDSF